jgi:hypothetical protein
MLVGRTLSVPWVRGHEWAGTPKELEEAWAAEVSRGCVISQNISVLSWVYNEAEHRLSL